MFLLSAATQYSFIILPKVQTSIIDEGASFEFRCEYSKGSTDMKWFRKRHVNGSNVHEYLPRNVITVLSNERKSVELYSMKNATLEDSGVYGCEVIERGTKRTTEARILLVKRKYILVYIRYTYKSRYRTANKPNCIIGN